MNEKELPQIESIAHKNYFPKLAQKFKTVQKPQRDQKFARAVEVGKQFSNI